jgi:hypothetical protein
LTVDTAENAREKPTWDNAPLEARLAYTYMDILHQMVVEKMAVSPRPPKGGYRAASLKIYREVALEEGFTEIAELTDDELDH